MAFKAKPILTCCIFIRLSFITVSGFAVFHEGKRFDSAGYFNKNARTIESFDRGDQKPKSAAQVGRLLIWQDQSSKSHGGGSVRFSSDFSSNNQPDENTNQSEDSGWMKLQHLGEQVYGLNTLYTPSVERLLGMKPKVDCVGDLMKLTVHGREAPFGSNFLIDRGSIPPLPLVHLPSECGHIFLRTWRDFVFTIPYNGCYVSQERDTFVLPLLWWGLPVKMSCSSLTSTESEPMVSCYSNGMIVRLNSRGVSENLKIKGMNEWQPLLKVSARCGYTLVSHPEGVVIHAPYMPCMEPKDGMFTLSMAIESEFNLSCPALSQSLPISAPDLAHENELISVPHALTSTTLPPTTISTTTKMTPPKWAPTTSSTTSTSSVQKLASPPFPHYIPGQPVPPSYPFLLFPPNIPPKILPPGPKIVGPPTAITKRPQAQVYTKRPQTWYPWYPKPSLGLTRDTSHQSAAGSHYPRKPLMVPITPLLKPTGNPQDQLTFTTTTVPPLQWVPLYPPSNMIHPLYPGKPEFVSTSSAVFPQVPYRSHHSQIIQRPSEPHSPPKPESKTPIPAPTRKTGPQLLQSLWYKPFPPHRSEMPPVPTKVLRSKTISTYGAVTSSSTTYSEEPEQALKPKAFVLPYKSDVKCPPMNFQLALSPSTDSTPSLPKLQVVHTHTPIKAASTLISSSHACSFHCTTSCSGPPSIVYHHHNHHHFGHPFQMSNLDISSVTKIKGQMLSSPYESPGSNLLSLIQAMGYNHGQVSSQHTVPPASDYTAMQYLVENPLFKDTDAPVTSQYLTEPTMSPYIFRKLESTAPPPQSTMKPANVAPVIHPLGPSKLHSRLLQNRTFAEPLDFSDRSPDPAVNQPEIKRYFSPWGHDTQPMLVAPNNVPSFEEMVQHDISSKPTMPPTNGKNVFMNYWYQAYNSNAKPSMSNFPTKDSLTQMLLPPLSNNQIKSSNWSPQPEQSHGKTPPLQQKFQPLMQFHNSVPVISPELHFPPNGESIQIPAVRRPRLFETHWVPAVQPKKDSERAGNGANLQ